MSVGGVVDGGPGTLSPADNHRWSARGMCSVVCEILAWRTGVKRRRGADFCRDVGDGFRH